MELNSKQRLGLSVGIQPDLPAGFSIPDGALLQQPRCDLCGANVTLADVEKHSRWHEDHDGPDWAAKASPSTEAAAGARRALAVDLALLVLLALLCAWLWLTDTSAAPLVTPILIIIALPTAIHAIAVSRRRRRSAHTASGA